MVLLDHYIFISHNNIMSDPTKINNVASIRGKSLTQHESIALTGVIRKNLLINKEEWAGVQKSLKDQTLGRILQTEMEKPPEVT